MKKIGIISDTHSFIDDKVIDFFAGTDYILHAGDIGDIAIIDKLNSVAKLIAVFGNIDNQEIRTITKQLILTKIEDVSILMTHIGGYPKKYRPYFLNKIKQYKPQLVITGHSHILKVMFDKDLEHLHINPGAYGKSGFHKVRTAVKLTIDGNNMKDLEALEIKR